MWILLIKFAVKLENFCETNLDICNCRNIGCEFLGMTMAVPQCRYPIRTTHTPPTIYITPSTGPLMDMHIVNDTTTSPPSSSKTNGDYIGMDWFNIMILTICTFGIIGNIGNLMILTQRRLMMTMDRLEKAANYGLIALAISDMGFCVAALPYVFCSGGSPNAFTLYYKIYGSGLINMFLMSSTWLIVSMAISRYIVVVYPIHARFNLSALRTVGIIILVYVCSTVATIPYFIRLSVEQCVSENNDINHQFQITFNKNINKMLKLYTVWIWPIISTFIPVIGLLFCNSRLIQELRNATKARRIRAQGQRVSYPSQKVTLTLVIIVVMLFVLVIPAEVLKYINPYSWGNIGHVIAMVANVMQTINFAFNFVLYCVLSPSFRHTIKHLFPTCKKNQGDKMEMQTMLSNTQPHSKPPIDSEVE